MYIFSYGSLRNPRSRALTLPGERTTIETSLRGYVKKFNAPVNGYLYLNIVPKESGRVLGTLIPVSDEELERVKLREPGYECVEVSSMIGNATSNSVFTFIAPDKTYKDMRIPKSYINTCLTLIPESEKESWLEETLIENEICEDADNPVYENAV